MHSTNNPFIDNGTSNNNNNHINRISTKQKLKFLVFATSFLIFAAGCVLMLQSIDFGYTSSETHYTQIQNNKTKDDGNNMDEFGRPVFTFTAEQLSAIEKDVREERIESINWMEQWGKILKKIKSTKNEVTLSTGKSEQEVLEQCKNDVNLFRIFEDPNCIFVWLRRIAHTKVAKASKFLPVVTHATSNELKAKKLKVNGTMEPEQVDGGFSAYLKNGDHVYFKACTTTASQEQYYNEITAFTVDQLVGFQRTPAVWPHYFHSDEAMSLVSDYYAHPPPKETPIVNYYFAMETMLNLCGFKNGSNVDGIQGVFVGWVPHPVKEYELKSEVKQAQIYPFHRLKKGETAKLASTMFNISYYSAAKEKELAMENMNVNLFALLTSYLWRFSHNIYSFDVRRAKNVGPLVFLDNDRTNWRHEVTHQSKRVPWDINNYPMKVLCKFPRLVTNRLRLLRPPTSNESAEEKLTLGKLVQNALSIFDKGKLKGLPQLFGKKEAARLDLNVAYILEQVDICINKYGEHNVLIPDPKNSNNYPVIDKQLFNFNKLT